MTKCYLFMNDITVERLESKLFCNKLEGKILEWCCPLEFCVMLEMFLCTVMIAISKCDYMHLICSSATEEMNFIFNLKSVTHD